MTDLRTAAQQALEALKMMRDQYEEYACPACDHADAAIYALKEALVEDAMQKFTDVNQELEAALAEPVQEPVAWTHINGTSDTKRHQPQRKPLTEEAIKQLLFESAGMTVTFSAVDLSLARAIERAHGIT